MASCKPIYIGNIDGRPPVHRGERLLQTHILIGQEAQLPSSDWTRAIELYLLSNLNMSLYQPFTPTGAG